MDCMKGRLQRWLATIYKVTRLPSSSSAAMGGYVIIIERRKLINKRECSWRYDMKLPRRERRVMKTPKKEREEKGDGLKKVTGMSR